MSKGSVIKTIKVGMIREIWHVKGKSLLRKNSNVCTLSWHQNNKNDRAPV